MKRPAPAFGYTHRKNRERPSCTKMTPTTQEYQPVPRTQESRPDGQKSCGSTRVEIHRIRMAAPAENPAHTAVAYNVYVPLRGLRGPLPGTHPALPGGRRRAAGSPPLHGRDLGSRRRTRKRAMEQVASAQEGRPRADARVASRTLPRDTGTEPVAGNLGRRRRHGPGGSRVQGADTIRLEARVRSRLPDTGQCRQGPSGTRTSTTPADCGHNAQRPDPIPDRGRKTLRRPPTCWNASS